MTRIDRPTRPRLRALILAVAAIAPAAAARAQVGGGGGDQLSKILTDPDRLEELKKDLLKTHI